MIVFIYIMYSQNKYSTMRLSSQYQEYKQSGELDQMLKLYTPVEKQQIFMKIEARRKANFEKVLKAYNQQQKELIKKNEMKKPSKYKSSTLNGMPLYSFSRSCHFIFIKRRQQQQCTICAQKINQNDQVSQCFDCVHIFHSVCIQQWFFTKQNPKCPNCRSKLTNKGLELEKNQQKLNQLKTKMKGSQDKEKLILNKFKQKMIEKMIQI